MNLFDKNGARKRSLLVNGLCFFSGERERVVLFPRAMRGEGEPNRMQGQSLHLHLREDPGSPA